MRNNTLNITHVVHMGSFEINVWNEQTGTYEHHEILVDVDAEALAKQLARKAVVSKARKSKAVFGAVVVTDWRKIS